MRALVLSDIHANFEALTAVLDDALTRGGFDAIWCLGDLVGYGPDPGPCLELLGTYDMLAVTGNHDMVAARKMSAEDFNGAAREAIRWTAEQLTDQEREFLAGLPEVTEVQDFTLVHGSLRAPVEEYLLGPEAGEATLRRMKTRFCLVGHSHIPFICRETRGPPLFHQFTEGRVFPLGQERLIINPGCVGQPRDRDPRPSYAIYDSEAATVERHRVDYSIPVTQQKMREANLPEYLIDRLEHGV